MDREESDGSDESDYGEKHSDDEFSGSICGLGRGLGDTHGVDEGVRDDEEELH